jgi:hypothetical protein
LHDTRKIVASASGLFIQSAGNNAGYPPASNQLSINLPAKTSANDLIIVSVGWGDQTNQVASIKDASGDTYQSIVGPTNWSTVRGLIPSSFSLPQM